MNYQYVTFIGERYSFSGFAKICRRSMITVRSSILTLSNAAPIESEAALSPKEIAEGWAMSLPHFYTHQIIVRGEIYTEAIEQLQLLKKPDKVNELYFYDYSETATSKWNREPCVLFPALNILSFSDSYLGGLSLRACHKVQTLKWFSYKESNAIRNGNPLPQSPVNPPSGDPCDTLTYVLDKFKTDKQSELQTLWVVARGRAVILDIVAKAPEISERFPLLSKITTTITVANIRDEAMRHQLGEVTTEISSIRKNIYLVNIKTLEYWIDGNPASLRNTFASGSSQLNLKTAEEFLCGQWKQSSVDNDMGDEDMSLIVTCAKY